MGNGGVYLEDQEDQLSLHHDQEELTYNQAGSHHHQYLHSKLKEPRLDGRRSLHQSDEVYQNGSYLGFHRPLGVIPPSSGSPHSRTPPIYHITPPYHRPYHHTSPFHHVPGPTTYGTHFPSHFYPEKLYQY